MTSKQIVSIVLNIFLVLNQTIYAASLEVDAAASSANKAALIQAPNGVPIINIVAPNAQGLSHNKFTNFNVNPQGVILNNAKALANTQLAGFISYNPNLTAAQASLILNEVTGTNKTLLNGYTEVAGLAADVIIANPNGISVNGGGFINTPNATLTTGTPMMNGNLLQGFDIGGGNIIIEGDGFNGNNIAKVNLYAKAFQLNAKLYADELNVVTGENTIALDGTVTSKNFTGSGISIDSSLLGGIYANTITLKSTDKGIGVNLPPEVFAQNSLSLTADGSIVASKVVADTQVSLTSQSANVNLTNDISANNIAITAGKELVVDLDKVIEASLDMTIVAETINNKGELNALSGTGKNSITATQNINNEGLIGGYDVDVKANSIDNTGALYSKNNLVVTAQTLNNTGVIRSNKAIELLVKNTLTNQKDGVIYSDDTLNIAANSAKDKINTVTNYGLIQSDKNINITAQTLNNTATSPIIKQLSSSTTTTVSQGGGNNFDIVTTNTQQQLVDVPSNPALIIATGDITLNLGTLNNSYSLIATDGNIVLNATLANNVGKVIVTTTDIVTTQYRNQKSCKKKFGVTYGCHEYAAYMGAFTQSDTTRLPIAGYGIQAKKSISGNVVTLNNISDQLIGSLDAGQIQAKLTSIDSVESNAKSLQKLTTSLANSNTNAQEMTSDAPTITSAVSAIATLSDLDNFKTDLASIKTGLQESLNEAKATLSSLESIVISIKALGNTGGITHNTTSLESTITVLKNNITLAEGHLVDFETIKTSLLVVADATTKKQNLIDENIALSDLFTQNATALTSLNITPLSTGLETVGNTLRTEVNVALDLQNNIEYKIISANEGLYQTNTHNALSQTSPINYTANSSTIIDNITLPKGKYGTFLVNKASDHPYLIEANPLFTNFNTFISSDYMLSKLDYRPEKTLKRLGDAMYETGLVSNSVIRLSGDRYLQGYASELAQFQGLMDNAITLQSSLDLHVGISLSKEQISRLNKNIVWMVEKVVDGQSVLVPEVYLSSNNISSDGAKIAAGNINLVIQDTLLNDGLIASEGTLQIATGSKLTNKNGTITSVGTMLLSSNGELENLSGTIQSGGDMSLIANSITSTSLTQDKTYNYAKGIQSVTLKGKESQFLSNGNIAMQTANDITLANTHVQATENITLSSINGAVNIEALETKGSYNFSLGKGYNKGESITNAISSIEGKNIAINANQVNIIASSLSATENITLQGKEGVNILALNDLISQDTKIQSSSGFMGKKVKQDAFYKESVVSSDLSAKNIVIKSDKDVTLEAAKLKAKENVIVDAKEDINIVAKAYKEGELHSTKKSGFLGMSSSYSLQQSEALKLKEALLQTEAQNVILKSGNDINIIASKIDSASSIQLEAFNNLIIAAGEEQSSSQNINKKSSFSIVNLVTSLATAGLLDTGAIYSSEINKQGNYSTTAKSSSLIAKENITADTGSAKIIGSNLEAGKNITLQADIGGVEILSAEELTNASSLHKKEEFKLANAFEIERSLAPKLGETKTKITIAKATYDKEETSSQGTNHISSNINARGGSLVVDSSDDVTITGSNLKAKDTISLNSKVGNVIIQEAINTFNENTKEKHASAAISVTVQNEYAEIGSAVKAALEAALQLKRVKEEYQTYNKEVKSLENTLTKLKVDLKNKVIGIDVEDVSDLEELIDNIKEQKRYYVGAIAAASVNLTSATIAIAAQTATAIASSYTWGFSVGLALDLKGSQLLSNAGITQSLSSSLYANDIAIKTDTLSDTTTTISGSTLVATNNLDINTHDLHVKSSSDTKTFSQNDKDISGTLSVTMYGGGSGMGGSLGYGQSNMQSDEETHTNAELLANNINITTTNDASFEGANVRADDTLNLKVGGNLDIISQRDTASSNSKGFNVGVSASLGGDKDYTSGSKTAQGGLNQTVGARTGSGLGSAGGSFGASSGNSLMKETILTSLTGENVTVEVDGNTHLKGALLAAGSVNEEGTFIDNEKLKLKTDTLTFTNNTNSMYSSSNSFNAGTNIGFGTQKNATTNADESTTKVNSSSLSLTNTMGYSSSKVLATLGIGDIQIGDSENSDDTIRLNRDTTKINKDLYSGSVSSSVTATLDHRLLMEDGRKQIAQDFLKTRMLLDTINQVATNKTIGATDFFAEIKKRDITYETVKEKIAQDKDLSAVLSSTAYTKDQKDAIINGITQQVMIELGYKPVETILIATTEPGRDGYQVKGYYSVETGKAYVNDFYNNNNVDLLTTAGTEAQRAMDAQKGSTFNQSQEYRDARSEYSQNFGSNIASYTDFALYFTGQGSLSTSTNPISTTTQTQANNAEFAGLNKELGDNLTKVYIWKGVGLFESAFGHVSASVNDTSYSFGPNGMDIKPVEQYINRQKEFRNGIAVEIPLSTTEEAKFENFLKSYDRTYWLNYCASPINQGLQSLGYQFDSQIIPMSLYMEMMKNNLGINPTVIEQQK